MEPFVVPGTWLGLVNSYVHYARQTLAIYKVLPFSKNHKNVEQMLSHDFHYYCVRLSCNEMIILFYHKVFCSE